MSEIYRRSPRLRPLRPLLQVPPPGGSLCYCCRDADVDDDDAGR